MAIYNIEGQLFSNEVGKLLITLAMTEDAADLDAATAVAAADETLFKDASSVSRAHTLVDGAVEGDTVRLIKRGGAGVGTMTPATYKNGTSIPLTNAGDFVSLRWNGTAWENKTTVNLITGVAIATTA